MVITKYFKESECRFHYADVEVLEILVRQIGEKRKLFMFGGSKMDFMKKIKSGVSLV